MPRLPKAERWILYGPGAVDAVRMRVLYVLVLLALIGTLAGCALGSAVQRAETAEQTAYALYGSYVIALEHASEVVADPAVPLTVAEQIAIAAQANREILATLRGLAGRVASAAHAVEAIEAACAAAPPAPAGCVVPPALVVEVETARSNLDAYLQENQGRLEAAISMYRSL